MTTARAFRGFRFPTDVILWAVRWYLLFPVSYRDLEAMLLDRGVSVDHTTMYRWFSISHPSSRSGYAGICAPAAVRGTSMKPMSGSAGNGAASIVPSTAGGRQSTSCSAPRGTRRPPSAPSATCSAARKPTTRGRSPPIGSRAISAHREMKREGASELRDAPWPGSRPWRCWGRDRCAPRPRATCRRSGPLYTKSFGLAA